MCAFISLESFFSLERILGYQQNQKIREADCVFIKMQGEGETFLWREWGIPKKQIVGII